MKKFYCSIALSISFLAMGVSHIQAAACKAAIFVDNRAGKQFNDKVAVLEDLVSSRLGGKGFSTISRDVVTSALKNYSGNDKQSTNSAGQTLDEALNSNTSALRLAQNLGADSLIAVSLVSYGVEKKTFSDQNISTVNQIHTLRVTYKICDAVAGGSIRGDAIKVSRTIRATSESQTESTDLINDLLDEASNKIAESVKDNGCQPVQADRKKGKKNRARAVQAQPAAAPVAAAMVDFTVSCGMQDIANLPVSVPDVRVNKDGTVVVGSSPQPVQVLDATVELNGTVVGSAPGTFKGPPGLSKIRISREGFKDWERTINLMQNQSLRVALQMTEEGYQRWKNNLTFLQNLENGKKLTDAEVKVLEGKAQALRQSGYKIDFKVDTKEGLKGGDTTIVR